MRKLISRVMSYCSSGRKKFFLIGFILIILSSVVWRWPVHITLPVRGRVLDAVTGKPIENAVVSCRCLKSLPSISGPSRSFLASEVSVTDKNGNYYIPMKITFHIISWFDEMSLGARHPLYEGHGADLYRPPWRTAAVVIDKGIGDISNAGKIMPGLLKKRGVIRYDVKLMSLEEKYVKAMENAQLKMIKEDNKKLDDLGYKFQSHLSRQRDGVGGIVNFKYNGKYLFIAEEIFQEWGKLVERAIFVFDKIGMKERAENLRLVFKRTKKCILERRKIKLGMVRYDKTYHASHSNRK